MELLLFLSAILTALTGAMSGVRVQETVIHQRAGAVAGCSVIAATEAQDEVPVRSWLSLAAPEVPVFATAASTDQLFGLAAYAPLYLSKLRR